MSNITKSVSVINHLVGLILGNGFTMPIDNTIKKYREYRFIS
ncbi:MAG: hypothetical protein PHE50_05240 [Dehalococcoidales bacterium]|nr:hypothetical protein [Dehalococcoidales bacterium]